MRPEKKALVSEFRGQIEDAEYVILADYRGLTVEQFADLRSELRNADSKLIVVKNTMLRHAAEDLGWENVASVLDGPTAMISGDGDVTRVAKVIKDFARKNEMPVPKCGKMGDTMLTADDVNEMANLPSREVLLGKFVGTVAAPMTQLVGAFNQKVLSLLYVLKAVEDKKR